MPSSRAHSSSSSSVVAAVVGVHEAARPARRPPRRRAARRRCRRCRRGRHPRPATPSGSSRASRPSRLSPADSSASVVPQSSTAHGRSGGDQPVSRTSRTPPGALQGVLRFEDAGGFLGVGAVRTVDAGFHAVLPLLGGVRDVSRSCQGSTRRRPPSGTGCADCEDTGGWWFHLRRCAQCGHIGCCDSSPSQHARAHAAEAGSPGRAQLRARRGLVLGLHHGAGPSTGRELAPPHAHPVDQPAPGPRGRVPADWRAHLH